MSFTQTEKLLREWGKWARLNGSALPRYMSPATAVYLRSIEQNRSPEPEISEDVALQIDSRVAALARKDEICGAVVMLYFLDRHPIRKIMRLLSIPDRQVNELIDRGIGWIDASLDSATQEG